MFSIKNLFRKNTKKIKETPVSVTFGQKCPSCGGYGLFSYYNIKEGKFYMCEDCFEKSSVDEVNEFNTRKKV
jgi:ssDNA-binding Zn-finger/Zn-ribbon topoisomerase 1